MGGEGRDGGGMGFCLLDKHCNYLIYFFIKNMNIFVAYKILLGS